jgi:hypothetical protein
MHLPKSLAIILIIVIVAFFIGVGILVGKHLDNNSMVENSASLSPYSAVYLSTGDVYFGILDWSPSPHIENPWFLQRSTNAQGQATIGVYPFSQVAWGPSDSIYFNSQGIVFWTRLASTSSVVQAMSNPGAGVIQEDLPSIQSTPASTTTSST